MKRQFAAQAWVVWVLAMAIITLVTRNPLYILILLLVARIVQASCADPAAGLKIRFWRLAAVIIFLSALFNLLMVHIGATVIGSLPDNLWVIGGDLTVEAAAYGAVSGLILVTLLAIFFTFNAVVPVNELIRLTPRALANVGLVTMIALTFVPETMEQIRRIRDSQAVRGHRLKGFRDWQPIIIPVLISGLERAMSLAETMVARGYGSTSNVQQSTRMQAGMLIMLILALGGWMLTFWVRWAGWIMILISVLLILGLFILLGKEVKHTRYRPKAFNKWDWIVTGSGVLALLLVVVPFPFVDHSTLYYSPYPRITFPSFDLWLGLAMTTLVVPAIVVEFQKR